MTRFFDAHDNGHSPQDFGDLPEWDFSALYQAPDSQQVIQDLERLKTDCETFATRYSGQLASLSAQALRNAVEEYEAIEILSGKLMSFAGLRYYQNSTDAERAKFLSDIQDDVTQATSSLVFFALEVNRIEETSLADHFDQDPALARYKPIFDRLRAMRPHQLSDELEKFLHDQSVVGTAAWNRLFDETIAGLRFDVDGEQLGIEPTLNLLTDPQRQKRETAARALAACFSENIALFARVHNTLAKEKEIEDRWRNMPSPQSGRHLANQVEPEVVEALRNAVVGAYSRLSHRYYELKRRWLGLDKLQIWDRNAPLPMEDTTTIMWNQARDIVLDAYAGFSPDLAEIARPFFDNGWIDAAVKPGKSPGAFAHPTVSTAHPFIMLNYLGKPRDVMTLAHELGHGVHQVLAAKQGELLSSTPLTLAETASVFGEMLTFQKLLGDARTNTDRRVLLANKVEDMINTVIRQIAFYDFECKLHDARRAGELTPQDINALWMSVQAESLGPAFEFMDGYESFWAYIPHFVHSPFYVYAYAFGDGLVNALYASYASGTSDFERKYFDILRAGGSLHHSKLLAPMGLDASDPSFWDQGLNMIEEFIDQLEELEK